MTVNISDNKLKMIREEFKIYLKEKNPKLEDDTIDTYCSDAFYILNNDIGIDFWDSIVGDYLPVVHDKIREHLSVNSDPEKAKLRATDYLKHLKELKTFIEIKYPDIKVTDNLNDKHYKAFKYLLKRFVEQAETNISDKEHRDPTLGDEGFENNNFSRSKSYDIIHINEIKLHVHLFSNGSYGPQSGNGSSKVPYFGYQIENGKWANVRVKFTDNKVEELKSVIWYHETNKDDESNRTYPISQLDLFSENEPNNYLKRFYDDYTRLHIKGNHFAAGGDDVRIEELVRKLERSKNIILRGAPGTGKTYLARQIASAITGVNENEIDKSDQYAFVQFHPSYDYTDFVEGLRPVIGEDDEVSFEIIDGIFKAFCKGAKKGDIIGEVDNFEEAWENLINTINESESDYLMDRTHVPATLNSHNNIKFNTPVATKENIYKLYRGEDTQLKYETYQKIVLDHLFSKYELKAFVRGSNVENNRTKYVFVIDEINRGEISKIFGELFFSIDPGYRGDEKYGVYTQYSNLHKDVNEKFSVPDNVYIIGTMNDIDRSVDSFDFAMRRRFRFVEIKAEDAVNMWNGNLDADSLEEAKARLMTLNKKISETDDLNANYHIGPSYFLKLPEIDYNYEILWDDYLKPLIEEYVRGSYDEDQKIAILKRAYDLVKDENDAEIETDN